VENNNTTKVRRFREYSLPIDRKEALDIVRGLSEADKTWLVLCLAADEYEDFLDQEVPTNG